MFSKNINKLSILINYPIQSLVSAICVYVIVHVFTGPVMAVVSICLVPISYMYVTRGDDYDKIHNERHLDLKKKIITKLIIVSTMFTILITGPLFYSLNKVIEDSDPEVITKFINGLVISSLIGILVYGYGHVSLRGGLAKAAIVSIGFSALASFAVYIGHLAIPGPIHGYILTFYSLAWNGNQGGDPLSGSGFRIFTAIFFCVTAITTLAFIYVGATVRSVTSTFFVLYDDHGSSIRDLVKPLMVITAGVVFINLFFAGVYSHIDPAAWNLPDNVRINKESYSDQVFLAFYFSLGGAVDNLLVGGPPRRLLVISHVFVMIYWVTAIFELIVKGRSGPRKNPPISS